VRNIFARTHVFFLKLFTDPDNRIFILKSEDARNYIYQERNSKVSEPPRYTLAIITPLFWASAQFESLTRVLYGRTSLKTSSRTPPTGVYRRCRDSHGWFPQRVRVTRFSNLLKRHSRWQTWPRFLEIDTDRSRSSRKDNRQITDNNLVN